MHSFFQIVALHLFVNCIREWRDWNNGGRRGPEPNCPRYYWDLVYFYRFGLPKIPAVEELDILKWWNRPQPDPLPFWITGLELLPDLFEAALDDPNPQPNIDFLNEIFVNRDIRIDSLKRTIGHFENAIIRMHSEAQRLEQLQ